VTPAARRQVSEVLVTEHQLSVRHACRAVGLSRTAWYRRPVEPATRDQAVREAVLAVVEEHGRWGFWKCFDRLRLLGHRWNHKHVHRVYCALRLNLPRRAKRRVPTRLRQPLVAPTALNGIWALDFMHDALYCGRRFRTFNVLDEGNREALGIEVGHAIPAERVVRVLDQLIAIHGRPAAFRLDNGPEFTAQAFTAWCEAQGITLLYIQPGKPDQNAFIERFNRTYRNEVLDAYVFDAISEVQTLTDDWLPTYNDDRPHDALGRIPPTRFLPRPRTPPESNNAWCP
jgi:putative transposase